ncbi:hypothetical protein BGX27_000955 [Mortierella sp. AM989]|nr:hypothetical protein BGX27_000955 [Mortierella sp. AM989]
MRLITLLGACALIAMTTVHAQDPAAAPAPVVDVPAPAANAPVPVADAPAPVIDAPAPVTDAPAPATNAPAPVTNAPAPVADAPAPVVDTPALDPNAIAPVVDDISAEGIKDIDPSVYPSLAEIEDRINIFNAYAVDNKPKENKAADTKDSGKESDPKKSSESEKKDSSKKSSESEKKDSFKKSSESEKKDSSKKSGSKNKSKNKDKKSGKKAAIKKVIKKLHHNAQKHHRHNSVQDNSRHHQEQQIHQFQAQGIHHSKMRHPHAMSAQHKKHSKNSKKQQKGQHQAQCHGGEGDDCVVYTTITMVPTCNVAEQSGGTIQDLWPGKQESILHDENEVYGLSKSDSINVAQAAPKQHERLQFLRRG